MWVSHVTVLKVALNSESLIGWLKVNLLGRI